jgi:hypothetical protein
MLLKLQKDTRLLLALLLTSFVSVYFLPELVNKVVFLLILATALRTKLDYVYLVWFFIINDAPGRLFSVSSSIESMRIPLYSLSSGISISFQDFFLFVYLFKVIQIDKKQLIVFKKPIVYFFLFAGLLMIYSMLLGTSFKNIFLNLRLLLPWAFLIIIPYYIPNKYILFRVSYLIFPVVFFGLFSQFFSYSSGSYFDNSLRGVGQSKYLLIDTDENASRSYSNIYVGFFIFINALYFYYNRYFENKKTYFAIIIFASILSAFLTATRGFILSYLVVIFGIFLIFSIQKEFYRFLRFSAIALVALLILLVAYPIVNVQLQRSYDRFLTMESLVQGDITAGGTLSRLDSRAPKVMKKYWENPILGWGFSDEYHRYSDGHVGNHNLLLSVGIIGFLFLIGIYSSFIRKILIYSRSTYIQIEEGRAPLIYILALIAIFTIHSTSSQCWGYLVEFDALAKILLFSFLLTSVNVILTQPRIGKLQ